VIHDDLAADQKTLSHMMERLEQVLRSCEHNDATQRVRDFLGSASSALDMAAAYLRVARLELVELQARGLVKFAAPTKDQVRG
jgi:hypothetical protein